MAAPEFDLNDPIASFSGTWRRVVLEPRAFFEELPRAGGLQPPLAFAALCLGFGGVEFLLFGGGLKGLLGLVVFGLLRLLIGAAIFVLIARNLFNGQGDYEATFRALAYSSAVAAAIGLPIIKYFAALYGAYLAILGLEKAHSLDTVRALLTLAATAVSGLVIVYALGLGPLLVRVNPLLR